MDNENQFRLFVVLTGFIILNICKDTKTSWIHKGKACITVLLIEESAFYQKTNIFKGPTYFGACPWVSESHTLLHFYKNRPLSPVSFTYTANLVFKCWFNHCLYIMNFFSFTNGFVFVLCIFLPKFSVNKIHEINSNC